MWDRNTAYGARVEQRLANELIIWLVTQGKDGTPQPSPVWFLPQGQSLLIYSKPDTPKLRNIARSPQVALHFNTNAHGGDVMIFHGTATIEADAPSITALPDYVAKYLSRITAMNSTAEQFAQTYSVAIRVALEKIRGF